MLTNPNHQLPDWLFCMLRSNRLQFFLSLLALSLCLTVLIYHIPLDSDRLYFDALFRDLLGQGRWSEWKMAVAPGYFLDLILYGFAYLILPAAGWRLFFVTAMQAILCAAAACWLAREIAGRRLVPSFTLIVTVLALCTVVSAHSGAWVFLNSNNAHVAATFYGLLSTAALFRYFRLAGRGQLLLLVMFGIMGLVSTAVYVLCFVLPALVFLGVLFLCATLPRRKLLSVALAIVLGQVFASLLRRMMTFHDEMTTRVPLTWQAAVNSFSVFTDTTMNLFRQPLSGYVVSWLLATAIVLALTPFSLRNRISANDKKVDFTMTTFSISLAALFFFFAAVIVAIGAIASGGFGDKFAYRYFALPLSLSVVIAALKLQWYAPKLLGRINWFLICISIVLAFQVGFQLRKIAHHASPLYMLDHGRGRMGEELFAQCLDVAEKKGFLLKAGVSQYWLARSVEHFSPLHPMLPVFANLQPFFWMSSIGPLLRPSDYPREYNFAIVQTGGETAPFEFTISNPDLILPDPAKKYTCKDVPAEIWMYENHRLDQAVKAAAQKFLETNKFFTVR